MLCLKWPSNTFHRWIALEFYPYVFSWRLDCLHHCPSPLSWIQRMKLKVPTFNEALNFLATRSHSETTKGFLAIRHAITVPKALTSPKIHSVSRALWKKEENNTTYPKWIIQDNLLNPNNTSKVPLSYKVTYSQILGITTWPHLGPCAAYHVKYYSNCKELRARQSLPQLIFILMFEFK